MRKIAAIAAVSAAVAASALVGPAAPAHAAPSWNKTVKCEAKDEQGRKVPTRIGNSELGWNHFSGKHNIKKCKVLDGIIKGNKPSENDGSGRLVYKASLFNPGKGNVQFKVIAQYSRKTKDEKYDAGKGNKIGVITAFCERVSKNKCPNWVNE
ncbi:hypothetical protein [Streptomyces buecherae]|uniref:DUF3558 family protein n=1 Tax=Streptomyces buecherae TaxID=2763006 RepID=A0A7H8NGA9_9ACTN|nr:hypothetical protein [Streptomyces buecherae]QKW53502.1 hypothetical protein HUT08_32575 [Streptomyces buecherae]